MAGAGIVGDTARMEQILTNLVGNSAKFTSSGHILISARRHGAPAMEGGKAGEREGRKRSARRRRLRGRRELDGWRSEEAAHACRETRTWGGERAALAEKRFSEVEDAGE